MSMVNREELARLWAPTLAAAAPISVDDRMTMAKTGVAMPDGSFPIPDEAHLHSAIHLAGTPEQRKHTIKRAKALGLSSQIPPEWPENKPA